MMTDSEWAAFMNGLIIKWEGQISDNRIPFKHESMQVVWERDNSVKVCNIVFRLSSPLLYLLIQVEGPDLGTTWIWMTFWVVDDKFLVGQQAIVPNVTPAQAEQSLIAHAIEYYAVWRATYGDAPVSALEVHVPPELAELVDAHRILRQ
jgi:hypothetical protein